MEKEQATTKKSPALNAVQLEIERIFSTESGSTKALSAIRYLAAVFSGNEAYVAALAKTRDALKARRRAEAKAAAEAAGLVVTE